MRPWLYWFVNVQSVSLERCFFTFLYWRRCLCTFLKSENQTYPAKLDLVHHYPVSQSLSDTQKSEKKPEASSAERTVTAESEWLNLSDVSRHLDAHCSITSQLSVRTCSSGGREREARSIFSQWGRKSRYAYSTFSDTSFYFLCEKTLVNKILTIAEYFYIL